MGNYSNTVHLIVGDLVKDSNEKKCSYWFSSLESGIFKKIALLFFTLNSLFGALHTGDLVFRQVQGFFSEIARNFSPHDKRFSHVGMVYMDHNKTYVIHSVEDKDKHLHGVSKVTLKSFLSEAKLHAFYSLHFNDNQQLKLHRILEKQVKKHLPFDGLYSLKSENALYCTEFIWRVFLQLFNKDIVPSRTQVNGENFLSIEDILKIPHLTKIYQ